MKISGIYKITNLHNEIYYVGSSTNITEKRWPKHIYELTKNIHHNKHLQAAWNKYGKDSFSFSIVEEVPSENLYITEQNYLDIAKKEKSYNASFYAMGPLKGLQLSEEHKKKISNSLKGIIRKPFSNEHKLKIKESETGKLVSDITRDKMSASKMGINHSMERNRINSLSHSKKIWSFISPNGDIVTFKNLTEFCKNKNIAQSAMWRLHSGKLNQYKGWKQYV